jgi:dTDP-4-amino-4,6-dideoxygalactose transaminase
MTFVPRKSFLPFALPDFDAAETDAVREVLESGWITTGAKTHAFEKEFAAVVGAKHAVAVNSCTAAMHLALEAAGLKAGDEVITTPYTFAATAEVVRYFDARPVFVDIRPEDLNIDPDRIEAAVTGRTRAILPVHLGGTPADMDPILQIANRRGLSVVEDAAHAFPAAYKGRTVGSIGDATCFSFYATKTITTAEGGMVCTDRDDWADRCRIMSLHGISKDAWNRYGEKGSWRYGVTAPGFKYNMTDVAAAMGLVQLGKAERMRLRRQEIASRYTAAFQNIPALQPAPAPPDRVHAWHLYVLRLNADLLEIDRDRFIDELKARNIGTSVHFIPLHMHPYYRDTYGYRPEDYPKAYGEFLRAVSLPVYSRMSDADSEDVIAAVLDVAERHAR